MTFVDDHADAATLDLEVLPPVDQRIVLLLMDAGEEGRVLKPAGMIASASSVATDLLAHHRGS